jgi:sugar lactone lactonase YvrE
MTQHRPQARLSHNVAQPTDPKEPLGLKRRHFMGTALALDAAALLAACNGGGVGWGEGDSASAESASGSGSGSGSMPPPNYPSLVSTLAGAGASSTLTDGTGATATFKTPYGVALDSSGHVYVADFGNHAVRKITPQGVVSTLAGTGVSGSDNGTGATAKFSNPTGVAVDNSGHVYVADYANHAVRKIIPQGVVSTLAGMKPGGYADGTGGTAKFNTPSGVAVDSSGHVYVADFGNHLIRKISPAGVVSTLAGVGASAGGVDGTGGTAKFDGPSGVVVDASGNLYVADQNNRCVRQITPAGVVSTLAGLRPVVSVYGTGTAAKYISPFGIAVDHSGQVYVSDSINCQICQISPGGVIGTLAGVFGFPGYLDGSGATARFSNPFGIDVDSSGQLYVADHGNNRIRKITPI